MPRQQWKTGTRLTAILCQKQNGTLYLGKLNTLGQILLTIPTEVV